MQHAADIMREFGPFEGVEAVHGVSFDGRHVWIATGEHLRALEPGTGKEVRALDVPAYAGTAYDGRYLFQIAEDSIQKVDPENGEVLATIPTPGNSCSGLTWAEGALWIGQYRDRKILKLDPDTGAIQRTIETKRFVTGVTWADQDLWHGTWEDDRGTLTRIDPDSGEVLETMDLPSGVGVSGLEFDGKDRFYCGGGTSGKLRVVRRPSKR